MHVSVCVCVVVVVVVAVVEHSAFHCRCYIQHCTVPQVITSRVEGAGRKPWDSCKKLPSDMLLLHWTDIVVHFFHTGLTGVTRFRMLFSFLEVQFPFGLV